jgi:hypothetical protein
LFFFGIFGVDTKEYEIRDIQNVICKSCGSMTSYRLIKTYSRFHFFFIPLFKWSEKYYLISRCCNSVFEIPVELGKEFEGGSNVSINDNDLSPVYNDYIYGYGGVTCPSCHAVLEHNFSYCPYCGTKLK